MLQLTADLLFLPRGIFMRPKVAIKHDEYIKLEKTEHMPLRLIMQISVPYRYLGK